jgi:hypothetical protein
MGPGESGALGPHPIDELITAYYFTKIKKKKLLLRKKMQREFFFRTLCQ